MRLVVGGGGAGKVGVELVGEGLGGGGLGGGRGGDEGLAKGVGVGGERVDVALGDAADGERVELCSASATVSGQRRKRACGGGLTLGLRAMRRSEMLLTLVSVPVSVLMMACASASEGFSVSAVVSVVPFLILESRSLACESMARAEK